RPGVAAPTLDGEPLLRAPRRDRPMFGTDVADVGIVDHDREVAGHLELVAAADRDAVDPRERRLADLPEPVVRVLEGAEPFPVLSRPADVVLGPSGQVGPDPKE